jgi:hypothetical protein
VATAIAMSDADGAALTSTGAVYDWGAGSSGRLGNGGTKSSAVPVAVSLPAGASAAGLNSGSGAAHTLVVLAG